MTYIATAGAHSCACLAIARWNLNSKEAEDEYCKSGEVKEWNTNELRLDSFYSDVLYPIDQELGKTRDYPFSYLMNMIDNDERLVGKYITAVLSEYQYEEGYWPAKLRERGFKLVDKTNNHIGGINYIFVRNEARVEIEDDEE